MTTTSASMASNRTTRKIQWSAHMFEVSLQICDGVVWTDIFQPDPGSVYANVAGEICSLQLSQSIKKASSNVVDKVEGEIHFLKLRVVFKQISVDMAKEIVLKLQHDQIWERLQIASRYGFQFRVRPCNSSQVRKCGTEVLGIL